MRRKTYWKCVHGYRLWSVMLLALALCFTACKDDEEDEAQKPFDPSKPLVITGFTPEALGGGNDFVIHGDNFGIDKSRVKVTLGGKDAVVIGVNNQRIYCLMPMAAYDGDVQVSIVDENNEVLAATEAEQKFEYQKQWIVSTFIGKFYEVSTDFEEKEGPFYDCGGIKDALWFSWDPKSNYDVLYMTADGAQVRVFDFAYDNGEGNEPGYVSYFAGDTFDRVSMITWTADENCDMILSHNHAKDTSIGNYLFTRASGFGQRSELGIAARGVNGTMVHPETGYLYYTRYRGGDMVRCNIYTGETVQEFGFPASPEAYRLVLHPSGKYAYVLGAEKRHLIMRTDYNATTKKFGSPYTVAGLMGSSGYADGMGTFARLNAPNQGVFVRNEAYVGTRPDGDEYDFYFVDEKNHCIRILTPDGKVDTFAGRANGKTSGYANGEARQEALFNRPRAITYDEKRKCFYVGEVGNKVIRKIALEGSELEDEESTDNEGTDEGTDGADVDAPVEEVTE